MQVKTALSAEFAKLRKEVAAEKQIRARRLERASQHLQDARSNVIDTTRSLQELGKWHAMEGFCDVASLVLDARAIDDDFMAKDSVAQWSGRWAARHQGVAKAAPRKGVRGARQSPCCTAGTCICNRTRVGKLGSRFRKAALKVLQQNLFKKKDAVKLLMDAEVMLMFVGYDNKNGNIKVNEIHVVFVPCHYLRPWRPTFLALTPISGLANLLAATV